MRILATLKQRADERGVKFLVIGGQALNVHGYARQTGDLDLLVSKKDRNFWTETVTSLNYQQLQVHDIFARYQSPTLSEWPIDFMFIEEQILAQMLIEAVPGDFGAVEAYVPSIRHLIALKLHALKQRQEHREERDISDVRELVRRSEIQNTDLHQLCEKYDRLDVYELVKKKLTADGDHEAKDREGASGDYLDLPDAPDFISDPPFIPLPANILLCEEMLPVWNKRRLKQLDQLPVWTEDFYL